MNSVIKNIKILGHEKIEQELAHAIVSEKIFPTWIFCGPFGVGKASIAKKFAKCLLSGIVPMNNSLDISEDNSIHHLIDSRTHPDFFILEQSDDSISINETRELMQKIRKTPTLSKWRVVIIENASNLNKNIYNSMLKILEEPPKNTAIIMICQNTGNIPRTLLSRAYKINFNSLKDEQVEAVLKNMGIKEANELSKIANGSVGYAIYLKEHNGIEIFNALLEIFCSEEKKSLQYIIDNGAVNNFRIIKESLLKIFRMYIEQLVGIADYGFKQPNNSVEKEMKKMLEIISMINKSDVLMLDKQSVVAYAFEKFFDY